METILQRKVKDSSITDASADSPIPERRLSLQSGSKEVLDNTTLSTSPLSNDLTSLAKRLSTVTLPEASTKNGEEHYIVSQEKRFKGAPFFLCVLLFFI